MALDLRSLDLEPGGVRRARLELSLDPLRLGGQIYAIVPAQLAVDLEAAPASGGAVYLKMAFAAGLEGPCMRCLEPASLMVAVDAREYHDRAATATRDAELRCEYVQADELDIESWARDAIAERVPEKILCHSECAGLCPRCGLRLQPDTEHDCGEPERDTRWDVLRELL